MSLTGPLSGELLCTAVSKGKTFCPPTNTPFSCSSFNVKMPTCSDKGATSVQQLLLTTASSLFFLFYFLWFFRHFLLFGPSASLFGKEADRLWNKWNFRTDWKRCLKEAGKTDELDFRVKSRAIQLLWKIKRVFHGHANRPFGFNRRVNAEQRLICKMEQKKKRNK